MSIWDDDIFDDEDDSRAITEAFEEAFFAQAERDHSEGCEHHNVKSWADKSGYCVDCGVAFSDAADISSVIDNCSHPDVKKDGSGILVCSDCGIELEGLDFTQEWKYYGAGAGVDQNRCHRTKSAPKGIRSAFETHRIHISPAMTRVVEAKYNKVLKATNSKVLRGEGREAIIACCLFYAFQEMGEFRTAIHIREKFGLTQKRMSCGMTKYYQAFPSDRTNHITPESLLPWIMKLIGLDAEEHYRKIVSIIKYVSSASTLVERSNPQSVCAAIVFFYICINPKLKEHMNLNKTTFAKRVKLSDITISKLCRDIAELSKESISI